jgi:excisionase family DNA binding protein
MDFNDTDNIRRAVPLTLTVPEAAQLLQISRAACYDAVRRGDIPSIRIGHSIRVPRAALEAKLAVA